MNAIECELANFCPHSHPCNLGGFSEVALILRMEEFVWDAMESRRECITCLWQRAPSCQLFQRLISWLRACHNFSVLWFTQLCLCMLTYLAWGNDCRIPWALWMEGAANHSA